MKFRIISYGTPTYWEKLDRLEASLKQFRIPHSIERFPDKNPGASPHLRWFANVRFKPEFIERQMYGYQDENIVWVDADAQFLAFPELFKTLDCDLSARLFDIPKDFPPIYPSGVKQVLFSGCVFVRNHLRIRDFVKHWGDCIRGNPDTHTVDQFALNRAYKNCHEEMQFHPLPVGYSYIPGLDAEPKEIILIQELHSTKARQNPNRAKSEEAF